MEKKKLNKIFIFSIVFFVVIVIYTIGFLINDEVKIYEYNNYKTNFTEEVYALNDDNYISKTTIYVEKELTTLEKVKTLLETLIINNNKSALLPDYFNPILPINTKVLGATLENKIIKINFSKEFLNITQDQSEKMIEAITYTLTNIENINGVEIYVENQLLKFIPHTNKNIPAILTKEIGINKEYDFNNYDNINKVVLYFLGENNNYVPVTKYVNDEREKIEIIVENLTNKYFNNSNLKTLINPNTKLLDYNIESNSVDLTFNDYIFNDKEKKQIDLEVIDLICNSIFDNYLINSINIYANEEKIIEKKLKNIE